MRASVGNPFIALVSSSIVLGIQIGPVGVKAAARDVFPLSEKAAFVGEWLPVGRGMQKESSGRYQAFDYQDYFQGYCRLRKTCRRVVS